VHHHHHQQQQQQQQSRSVSHRVIDSAVRIWLSLSIQPTVCHCDVIIVTGRNGAKRLPAGIVFTHGPIFRFFSPRAEASRCTNQGEISQGGADLSLPNFTLIGSGVWVYGAQNFENSRFCQYNCQ